MAEEGREKKSKLHNAQESRETAASSYDGHNASRFAHVNRVVGAARLSFARPPLVTLVFRVTSCGGAVRSEQGSNTFCTDVMIDGGLQQLQQARNGWHVLARFWRT